MSHDCLMFGLNNSQKYEKKLASSFFSKACDLYQPEAMSFMAKETFFHFLLATHFPLTNPSDSF